MTAATRPGGPPAARRGDVVRTAHGVSRPDPYAWLRDTGSAEVLAHLRAERAWYDAATAHLGLLVETLRSGTVARMPVADRSVSHRMMRHSYSSLWPVGRDHPLLLRTRDDGSGGEEVLLDANAEATGSSYVDLGVTLVSPDERLLAWSVDRTGEEVFALRFRDLASGVDLPEEVPRSYYGGAWAGDSRTFFYTVHDAAYRPHQVWRHAVGSPVDEDVLVLEEPDERFEVDVHATRSGRFVVLRAASRDTAECWVVPADAPESAPRSVGGRRRGTEYAVEHAVLGGADRLLLVTDDGATEFRLAAAPVPPAGGQDHRAWEPLLPEDPAVRLETADAFATHLVLTVRTGGRRVLRVLPADDLSRGYDLAPPVAGGTIALGRNEVFDARSVTIAEQSYVDPCVWSEVDLATGRRTERHRQEAPGHDRSSYVCEVRSFAAPDGTAVPATLVRHRDTPLDGTAPALMYGYGAYEYSFEPEWDPALPGLLDRGVVFAHAHVRGGGEGGRRWWLAGRLAHKQHTFDDHLAVADGLAAGLVDPARIATRGLSAGGLLQAVVLSQRPERWRAVVAEVPFVDVVTTMSDPTIPLTVNEWDEWGDPRRPEDFAWLLAYSPCDNLPPAGGRPDLLVTGAVHDPRVMVWEPAKWVAALRHSDPAWSPRCLFRVETGEGAHAGPSGRLARASYEAEVHAWLLAQLGVEAGAPPGLG